MDLLDPLEDSTDHEIPEKKVIISEMEAMESDDEQVVDHLSPQTLLETPGETEYSVRGPDGLITYRVLQVDDGSVDTSVPQIVSNGQTFANAGVPQVITGNLNGQLYVISNSNEVFTQQSGARAIAPRSSIIDGHSSIVCNVNKKRDERRRATHNEVERRRRDKINNWITKLSKIIPETNPGEIKGNGHYDGQSKGGILAKACSYILELRESQEKLDAFMKENKQMGQTLELLKQKNFALERENKEYRELLKRNGIELPNNDLAS